MNYKLAKLGKYCLLGLLVSMSFYTLGQGVPPKVKKLYDKQEYEKCIEVSKDIKSKGDNIKNPYLYIYQVMAYYQIALNEDMYTTREPIKKALRAYTTFKRKDRDGSVSEEYAEFINEFRDFTIAKAEEKMNDVETMGDGLEMMMQVRQLFGEDDEMKYTIAKVMMEKGVGSTRTRGMTEMLELADKLYNNFKQSKAAPSHMDKVFADIATFMFEHSDKAIAQEYLDKGKEMYPNSGLLKGASMYILDQQISLNPEVSSLEQILKAKRSIEASLKEYPNDANLLRKEDAIIDILISKYFHQGSEEGITNTMMNHINKYANRRGELINRYRTYLNDIVLNKSYAGYTDYNRKLALDALIVVDKRLEGETQVNEGERVKYVKELLAHQFAKTDLDSLNYYYNLAEIWRPQNKTINSYMNNLNYKGITDKVERKPKSLYNLGTLINLADKTVDNKFYNYNEANYAIVYARQLLKEKKFSEVAYIINLERRRNPNDKRFLELKRELVIQDYIANYLGSEMSRDDYEWNGSTKTCKPGTVPPEIQAKVLQRITYVRRLAGVRDDIYFNEELNQRCQAAALMMQANSKLNHHPPKTWKCYTEDGARGAASSNLSLGHNLEDAVMGQMDDNGSNNTACGHRRWILSPNNLEFGHGSTSGAMALGVFGGVSTRSNVYDSIPPVWGYNDFIAWPSADYFIESLVPRRWSFSYLGADFTKAEVEVKIDGKRMKVNIEPLSNGYGLNTIVWYIDDYTYKAGQVVEVTISNYTKKYYTAEEGNVPMTTTYKVELLPTPKGS